MPPAFHVPVVPAIAFNCACVTLMLPLVSVPVEVERHRAVAGMSALLSESNTFTDQFDFAGGVGDSS